MTHVDRIFSFFPQDIALLNYVPPDSDESTSISAIEPEENDFLHFGNAWPQIQPLLQQGVLYETIAERRAEIASQKELWRPFIEQERIGDARAFHQELDSTLASGTLKPHKHGGGGVYFLCDAAGKPRFVVKPCDEAILCLNNSKQRGSPFNDPSHRLRDPLPLYTTCQSEAAVFALASEMGIANSTPETHLAILSSPLFYDLSSRLEGAEKTQFLSLCGGPDAEKLCSVQRFVPDSIDLKAAMHEWFEAGLENFQPLPIDQDDYEEVLLLLWMIYDGDGHPSNFRLFLKNLDENEQAVYALRKIDNGLALPEDNRYLLNYLGYMPNAKFPPSSRLLMLIEQMDLERLCGILDRYHLDYAKSALRDRIDVVKNLASRPITLEEFNQRFELLSLPNGKEYALSTALIEDLIKKVWENNAPFETTTPKIGHIKPRDSLIEFCEEFQLRA